MNNLTQNEKLFLLLQRGAMFRGPRIGGAAHGQGYVLSLLSDTPISQKELLEKLGIRAGSLSELLGKLEKAGYITRAKDEKDTRVVLVSITEAGKAFAEENGQHRGRVSDELFAVLSDEEKETLIALLEKLHGTWLQERQAEDEEKRGRARRRGFGHGRVVPMGPFGAFPGAPFGGPFGVPFGGVPGFGHPQGFGHHGEYGHGEHSHHGHGGHAEEITDPELKAYLDTLNCDICDHNCKLSEPHCGKGAEKQREAIEAFKNK